MLSLMMCATLAVPSPATGNSTSSSINRIRFDGNRPFTLLTPKIISQTKPLPLVLLLHGFTSSGDEILKYTGLSQLVNSRNFLLIAPNGSRTPTGTRFWNATPACCDFYYQKSNDAEYLTSIINKVARKVAVDRKRIFIIGHSNGGAMAHRMACQASNVVSAIVSLAGPTFNTRQECKPAQPTSVLQIWGTEDEVLNYRGGNLFEVPYPGAQKTVNLWGSINKCTKDPTQLAHSKDYFPQVKGAETRITTFLNCAKGSEVRLWSGLGVTHVPVLNLKTMNTILDFLYSNHK